MAYSDAFRNIILGASVAICDTSTLLTYFAEQILSNTVFLIFILVALVLSVFIIATVYIRKRQDGSNMLTYFVGVGLFFIALNIKILISFFGTQIKNIDEKLYSALEGITRNSKKKQ
jgi:hypothetical protein